QALESALSLFFRNNLSLLSCFSTQIIFSFSEWITVPLVNWFLLSFIPLRLIYTSRSHRLTAANGQFMMFDAGAYQRIGGHEKIKGALVEDMALGILAKKQGYRMATVLGKDAVTCRMYRTYKEAFIGLTKSFFPGMHFPGPVFILFLVWNILVFLYPFIAFFYGSEYLIAIGIIIAQRAIVSWISQQSLIKNILLHPLQMVVLLMVGLASLYRSKTKKIIWKERNVSLANPKTA
ncbi:glycosyltransferase, partial [Candidatus Omnitrophota bacterium]